jgi:hypothetical protein
MMFTIGSSDYETYLEHWNAVSSDLKATDSPNLGDTLIPEREEVS